MKCALCQREVTIGFRNLSQGEVCQECFQKTPFGHFVLTLENLLEQEIWNYLIPHREGTIVGLVFPQVCLMEEINPFVLSSCMIALRGSVDRKFLWQWKYRIWDAYAYERQESLSDSNSCGLVIEVLAREWDEEKEEAMREFFLFFLKILASIYTHIHPDISQLLWELQESLKNGVLISSNG